MAKHYWGRDPKRAGDKDPKTGKKAPGKPHKHTWTPLGDEEGNITGRVCTKCGEQQGKG